jgi:hypothetical protein
MSAYAIFVDFTPKVNKLKKTTPKLWGTLSPLERSQVAEDEKFSRNALGL